MTIKKETFCLAPWYGMFVDSNGKLAPCCIFKNKTHHYNQIDKYFKSDHISKVREDLLNGVKNHNCDRCWKDEENNGDSMRLIFNRTMALHGDVNILKQVKDPKISNIKSFELTLGNLCNLKCVMCTPSLSSQLLAEVDLNPALEKRYKNKYKQKDFDWPNSEDFVAWCDRYLPQAIHIKFTGGEPFIIPWINDAIEAIPDTRKANCVLHFTTNLTKYNDKLFNSFKKFKEVWLSVSVEGTHETHEYLRYGHSWNTLSNNLKKIIDKKIKNIILKINHVVQAPSYHSILDMTKFFDALKIDIYPILPKTPECYSLSSLTEEAKKDFLVKTNEYNGHNLNFIKFVRSVSQKYMQQEKTLAQACVKDLTMLDTVRGNDYKKVIPAGNLNI